ncbi:MAG: hypothetical protein ACOYNO_09850 [Saprospiraceae bacterium]
MNSIDHNLEAFIRRHREALDASPPDNHGWGELDRLLDRLPAADTLERSLLCNRPLLDTATPSAGIWNAISLQLDEKGRPRDTLEQFIRQHRDDFDGAQPSAGAWNTLQTHLDAAPKSSAPKTITQNLTWSRRLLRIAAGLALLLSGVGIGMWFKAQPTPASDHAALHLIAPEFAEMEQYYRRDIHFKQQKLQQFTANEDEGVAQDLQQLDHMMEELRTELGQVPPANREKVVRALLENYKAKAAILDRVLDRLEHNNENPNSKDDDIDRM